MAYNGRNKQGEWGLALGVQAQSTMIDIIGMSCIPMYMVVEPFLFFTSLLLMVWGGFHFIITVCLRVAIITRC
jgi:hypothetical protein